MLFATFLIFDGTILNFPSVPALEFPVKNHERCLHYEAFLFNGLIQQTPVTVTPVTVTPVTVATITH